MGVSEFHYTRGPLKGSGGSDPLASDESNEIENSFTDGLVVADTREALWADIARRGFQGWIFGEELE
jgi:hypothetical protein